MKKFFNKKSNAISVVLAVLGLVGILVMLIVPHGGKYTRTYEKLNKEITEIIELKDGKIYSSSKVDGKFVTEDLVVGEYAIDSGKISYKVGGLSVEFGEINAFRYQPKGVDEVKYTCSLMVVFFVIACAMTVVGVLGTVYGLTNANKKIAKKAKSKK